MGVSDFSKLDSIQSLINEHNKDYLTEVSEFPKRVYYKKANKYLRSCYKDVKEWMKKHKSQIIFLSKSIKDKNGISRAEMLELINN